DYTFASFIDKQMNVSPKANGTGTILAGRNLVEYYANPSNFEEGTPGYYQFLVLTERVKPDSNELNNKILYNKGSLKGTGEAFVRAGRDFGINEIYLISHALHETG